MPLVALIGSEAPGRIEWALSHSADAHPLNPVGTAGVYCALLIARQGFEAPQEAGARVPAWRAGRGAPVDRAAALAALEGWGGAAPSRN